MFSGWTKFHLTTLLLYALVCSVSPDDEHVTSHQHVKPNDSMQKPEEEKSYHGHSVIRVTPQHDHQLHLLNQLQTKHSEHMEFWRHPSQLLKNVDIRVSPAISDHVLPLLNQSGLEYNVMTDNVQSLIAEERSKRSLSDAEDLYGADNFSLTSYHTYDEISDWMDGLVPQCAPDCEVINIGNSYEGRPMKVLRIGKESSRRPAIWIDAGIHAREWIAPATALYIIAKLINRDPSDRISRVLSQRYTWYILPTANPDGYHFTWTMDRLWRKTRSHHSYSPCRGVDPNRNWDFHWGGEGTSDNPCNEDYHGEVPFSEPETRNIARFLLSLQSRLAVYLSLHSYGQYWLAPWGYTYNVPDDYTDMLTMGAKATDAMRRSHGSRYQVGSSARLLYLAAGGSDDWVKGVLGVKYSYTVELRDTGRHGFILPPNYIMTTGEEMLQATRSLSLNVLRERRRAARHRRRFS